MNLNLVELKVLYTARLKAYIKHEPSLDTLNKYLSRLISFWIKTISYQIKFEQISLFKTSPNVNKPLFSDKKSKWLIKMIRRRHKTVFDPFQFDRRSLYLAWFALRDGFSRKVWMRHIHNRSKRKLWCLLWLHSLRTHDIWAFNFISKV